MSADDPNFVGPPAPPAAFGPLELIDPAEVQEYRYIEYPVITVAIEIRVPDDLYA